MMELPELPEPAGIIVVGSQALRAFTADQMHAYAKAYAAAAVEAEREAIADALADALASDCENGVKWLNEAAADNFRKGYPELFALLGSIRARSTP
jgi:hypothetical protein